ncbi:3-hydroxyacyl-CoA dehydrogenase family protein [Syntrophomonas palmitatica]|uniref:3-hydroxyacyl-CoA dehydrogenase family protein n=1 Tax=Syntrophomonas palmitatica TaxID=402877 RepID=UPI0006D12D13|nr:3-hydroxyacyl-CoA dehydrogenase NAD-binding domain-containing protein [Syntrophomonas palmitatica]
MEKIAVLGAGIMGAGIAQEAAQAGYLVILRDLQMSLVKDGLDSIDASLEKSVQNGVIEQDEKNRILGRIHGTTDLAEVREVDLVLEAVVENMAVKRQIFAELDSICPSHTILATNTSSLSISEIAAATHRRDKVIGMHFFYPVPSTRLVELVKGMDTSDNTLELASEFADRMSKQSVVVKRESPGFIVNRILMCYINEAIHVLGDGMAGRDDIDMAMKLGAGMKYGPLEIADFFGLDTLYSIIDVFCSEFRDSKYRPHPLFTTMIRAGYFGKKSGRGFYEYNY